MDVTGIGSIADAAKSIVDKIWPDKTQTEKDAAALQMAELMNAHNLTIAQLDIDKAEASSTNWFVAGWRPAVGWVGAVALAYAAVLEPLMRFCAVQWGYSGQFPEIDTTITMQVLGGLLGLGTLRTIEKHQGVEGNRS